MRNPENSRPNPLREFMQEIEKRKAAIELDFSQLNKKAVEDVSIHGIDELRDQGIMLLDTILRIDRASTKGEKSDVAWSGQFNYLHILAKIAEAAVKIGTKKVVEGETLTNKEREDRVRAEGIAYGVAMGMTRERALQVIDKSIRFTKRIQSLVGASENPPEGGLRTINNNR